MFKWANNGRGIQIKDGMFCPRHQKTYTSEDEMPARQFKNRTQTENRLHRYARRKRCSRCNKFNCRWI